MCSMMSDRRWIQQHKHPETVMLPPKGTPAVQGARSILPSNWLPGLEGLAPPAVGPSHLIRACGFSLCVHLLWAYYGVDLTMA